MSGYYDLGEINIFIEKGGKYRFVSTGGSVFEVDLKTAASILALQGHTVNLAHKILENSGYQIDLKTVEEVANFMNSQNMANVEEEKPKSRRFETKKVLKNLRAFEQGPLIIQDVAVTASSFCPMNCKYCFRKYFPNKYKDRLNLEVIKQLITDLRSLGCLTINISGGEPGAFPELTRQIGEDARDKGFENISVSTCGYGLDERVLRGWKEAGITYLNLSLDTMDEEVQDRISGRKGAWKMAVRATELACKMGLQVRANSTSYQEALPSIEALAEFGKKVGVYKSRYNPLLASADLQAVSPQDIRKIVERVDKLEEKGYNVYCPVEPLLKLPDFMICAGGITKAVVEVDGSVGACQFLGSYPEPAGNILEESFIDIWTKGKWDYYRADLEKRTMAEPCRSCKERPYCISYCLAYAWSLLGDPKVEKEVKCPFQKTEVGG